MKRILVVSLAALLMLTGSALAAGSGHGKTLIPRWVKGSGINETSFYITNVSKSSVNVTITLYDDDGNVYTEASEAGTDVVLSHAFLGTDPLSSSGATLAANKTGMILMKSNPSGGTQIGFGFIEWTSTDDIGNAVMAYGSWEGSTGRGAIIVNNGMPF